MSICVTGGSGFIGQRLVHRLSAEGYQVRILTRTRKATVSDNQYFVADLIDGNVTLKDFLCGVRTIYHCAGEVVSKKLMYDLHVKGTARLLEALRREIELTKKPVHWVQLSSVGAYGNPNFLKNEKHIITETTPHSPMGEYEVTKTLSDELIMQLAKIEPLFTYTILRPSNVIGPAMPNQSMNAMIGIIKQRLFFYIGSRDAVATYIHLDDVVEALLLCGADLRARGQIFNLSNDCLLSEIVDAVSQASNVKSPTLCVPEKPLRLLVKLISSLTSIPLTQARIDSLVRYRFYPHAKIEQVLGFVPKHDIPDAIASMSVNHDFSQKS